MRILLTGSKGQLGQSIRKRLPEDWELIANRFENVGHHRS